MGENEGPESFEERDAEEARLEDASTTEAADLDDTVHDGSEIETSKDAMAYFGGLATQHLDEFRRATHGQWPGTLGRIDADVLINRALLTLARRARDRYENPEKDAFRREGAGLVFRQLRFEIKSEIRRRAKENGVTETRPEPGEEDRPEGLDTIADPTQDPAREVVTGTIFAPSGVTDHERVVRYLAVLADEVRLRLRSMTQGRRHALRNALEVEVGRRARPERTPAAERQSLRHARRLLAEAVHEASANAGLVLPEEWDNTFVDDVLLPMLDLGLVLWEDLD